jgi:leader peptidase (prepilin peptidase)/N-methyltransferase
VGIFIIWADFRVPNGTGFNWLIVNIDQSITPGNDLLADSLPGELLRLLLIGTASFSALVSLARIGADPIYLMLVAGNLVVLASVLTTRFAGAIRGLFLLGLALAVIYLTLQSAEPNRWVAPLVFFSPASLMTSLAILALRDFVKTLPGVTRRLSYRAIAGAIIAISLLFYMVVVPSIEAILEQFRDRPAAYKIEDLSVFEQLRIRSAKFAVFAIFTYVGACVASFVNVVASSAPRGGAVALRTSACPKCGAAIRRIDNLPIFSYLNLAGRCRNCAAVIPVRYFIVEVLGAIIFGALFLFELVAGAANVPAFPHYHYTGILWIILYTKWPVVGIYFYHAVMFSCLMMLALMDLDRLRCPKWLAGSLLVIFAGLQIAVPTLQPVAFDGQIPVDFSSGLPTWSVSIANCLIGGLVGWLIASLVRWQGGRRILGRFVGRQFPLVGAFLGIAVGWQATVTIFAFSTIATLVLLAIVGRNARPLRYTAVAVLSTVAFLHQPAWKWIAGLWY